MAAKRGVHWAWVILVICFVDLFINYSVRLGYGVVLPEMIHNLGFGRAAGGSIYNAYLFTYIAITPFTGYLTDRFGARRVITICLLFLGCGVLLMGTVNTLWTACLFFGFAGLGATGLWAPVITLVQRWFAFNRRGFALGILSTGFGLGFATIGAVFPWIVKYFNWRYAWFFLGAMALAMVAINGILLRSDPSGVGLQPWGEKHNRPDSGNQNKERTSPQSIAFRSIFKNSRFWLIGGSYLAIAYALYGITTFMVDYARYQLNVPLEKASLLATIHGVCQIAGVLTILPLSDYLGRKKTIIISNVIITCCLALILLAGDSLVLLYIVIGCLAVFYGATFPIYGACAGDYFSRAVMGTVIGAWTPFYGIGAILTHWITGALRDATGVYDQAFVTNILAGALAIVLMALVGKK
ncbi:MAG: MFS transporter [Desulfobacterales bacterium]|nr:MAG: MFS transporter [Desulfobacterales bacterium]